MTVWSAIEEILNENPNIMINIEKAHGMRSCLSIRMILIDPQTFKPIYNIRRIIHYKEPKIRFSKTTYENATAEYVKNMYLELKTKIEDNKT